MNSRYIIKFNLKFLSCLFFLISWALQSHAWQSSLYPEAWTPPENASFYTDKLIQDFSYAGYRRGEAPLPDVTGPIFDAVDDYNADPSGTNDSTAEIQAAIDAAAAAGGGVVYLKAGTYLVAPSGGDDSALRIQDSDIVLRGAGVGQTFILNTSYDMRGKKVVLIKPASTTLGSEIAITADLDNPTRRIPVADASAFSVGDIVRLEWSFTQDWIDEHNQGSYWTVPNAAPRDAEYLREVIAVDTNVGWIEVDVPTRYTMKTRDNARVSTVSDMLSNVGIEDLSIGNVQHPGTTWGEGDYTNPSRPAYDVHASWLIRVENSYDSWISGVESFQASGNTSTCHMLSNGILLLRSFRVTVANCAMRRSQYGGGGGNGYMYRIQNSHENLIRDSVADFSRHGFVISHAGTSGNVFLRCEDRDTKRSTGDSGSYSTSGSGSDHHMHFSHSNLFDQCSVHNSFFTASHRGNSGTIPHGLSSAHGVYWNTSGSGSTGTIVRSEQGRYGYVIGTSGSQNGVSTPTGGNTSPADHVEGIGTGDTLEPQSLHADQLAKRLQGLVLAMEEDAVVEITSAHPLAPSVYNYRSGLASYTWSQVSGPATTFVDASSLTTEVALPIEGTYIFELTADNGTDSTSGQITLTVLAEVIDPLANNATLAAVDEILGRSEDTNADPLGYFTNSSNETVGATGSSGSRTDSNVVYRYVLPTLPAGETIRELSISFQITALRDHSNNEYSLDVYVLDSQDPTTTGTNLFYHGPNDENHALAGSHYELSPNNNSYTLPEPVDVTLTIDSGPALDLLQSFYNGNQPLQSEVALRFNLDQDYGSLGGEGLNRYILNNDLAGSGLTLFSMPGAFADWVASYELSGQTGPGDDPDGDGIANIVEAWFGTHPAESSERISNLNTNGTTTTFTHPKNPRAPTNLIGSYEWSPNLEDWYSNAEGPVDGPTVNFTASTTDGTSTVTATSSETLPQIFLRVVVTQN